MKRRQFVKLIGNSTIAVCGACAIGCLKSVETPNVPTPNNSIDFNIDLTSQLLSINDVFVKNSVRVVRLLAGNNINSFTAVDQWCTHAAGNLIWNATQDRFDCPIHGSQFKRDGVLIPDSGPATKNLKQFAMALNNTTLTIKG